MRVFLRLFGGLRVDTDPPLLSGRATQKKRLALLALLMVNRSGGLSRDKLIGFLWPESDVERARHQLASAVYELRKAFGEDTILSKSDELRLNNTDGVGSDLAEFEVALASGDRTHAIAWYSGPFLDGFFVPEAPEFERWVDAERTRLAERYAKALEALARETAEKGDLLGAVDVWRKLAAHDLYNSRVAIGLIRALDAAGDRAAALQHARTHTVLLREDMAVEADPEVTALAERMRAALEVRTQVGEKPGVISIEHLPLRNYTIGGGAAVEQGASVAEPSAETYAVQPLRPDRMRSRRWVAALVTAVALTAFAIAAPWRQWLGGAGPQLPVVVMMDSPHPERVYDEEVMRASGTNADLINDMLRDLPVQRVKETSGPFWHRDEEIRQLHPELIVMHLSSFCTNECEPYRTRLRSFIEYLADTDTKFLIYSRMTPDELAVRFNELMGDLPERHPDVTSRIHLFSVVAHGTPHWKDPATASALKLQVKQMLNLNNQR